MTAPTQPPGSAAPAPNGVNPATANRAATSAGFDETNASATVDSPAAASSSESNNSQSNNSQSSGSQENGSRNSPSDGLETQFSELLAYLAHYVAAQRDLIEWRLRAFFWRVVVLVGAGLALLSVMVTAAVLVLLGLANGLGSALGNRMWAGELIVGLAVFIILAISRSLAFQRVRRRWRERIVAKYETYRQRERAAFGRDVERTAERRGD